ncbi:MAG: hypothetical protein IPP68_04565 [Elusimicrobia bacterium]|nr:hypothetical protein [Elusimicrobiota bacterium]
MSIKATIQKNSVRVNRWLAGSLWVLAVAAPLRADLTGPPILDNNYRLAFNPNVAVGSSRKVAMGGAYTGIAEGVDSLWDNPVAAAFRRPSDESDWGYDLTVGSILLNGDDVDNNGNLTRAFHRNSLINAGALVRKSRVGIGFYIVNQRYDVGGPAGVESLAFNVGTLAVGWASPGENFFWGAGFRLAALESKPKGSRNLTLHLSGSGGSVGTLWNPDRGPWRLGLSFSGPIRDDNQFPADATAPVVNNGLIIPRQVTLPVVASLGISYHFSRGTFWSDRPLQMGLQINAIAPTRGAVGVESFIEQRVQWTGEKRTYSYHLGGEEEIWPRRVRLRLGTYFEPSRFKGVKGRVHATGGFEVRLFHFNFIGGHDVSFSYAADSAARYFTQIVSVGFWQF